MDVLEHCNVREKWAICWYGWALPDSFVFFFLFFSFGTNTNEDVYMLEQCNERKKKENLGHNMTWLGII